VLELVLILVLMLVLHLNAAAAAAAANISLSRAYKMAGSNGEGLPPDYDDKIGDVLARQGYDVLISGKTDWTTGGHAEWNWMQW